MKRMWWLLAVVRFHFWAAEEDVFMVLDGWAFEPTAYVISISALFIGFWSVAACVVLQTFVVGAQSLMTLKLPMTCWKAMEAIEAGLETKIGSLIAVLFADRIHDPSGSVGRNYF